MLIRLFVCLFRYVTHVGCYGYICRLPHAVRLIFTLRAFGLFPVTFTFGYGCYTVTTRTLPRCVVTHVYVWFAVCYAFYAHVARLVLLHVHTVGLHTRFVRWFYTRTVAFTHGLLRLPVVGCRFTVPVALHTRCAFSLAFWLCRGLHTHVPTFTTGFYPGWMRAVYGLPRLPPAVTHGFTRC